MKLRLLVALLCLGLTNCSAVGSSDFKNIGVEVADEKMVKSCHFIGDVTGLSSFYGFFSGPAYEAARDLAAQKAKEMGGTHIVFMSGNSHYGGTEVYGRVYKCST